nr:accessory gland protein Acp29AB-like [Drosophila takahashii]
MLRLAFFFCCSLIVLNLRGSSADSQENERAVCILHDPPTQCGAFCLSALHPLFDHNRKMRNRLDVIEEYNKKAVTKEDFDAKLKAANSEIRYQLRSLRAGLTEIQTKMLNHEELLERAAFNIPPEFEKISNRFFYIERTTKLTWIEAKVKCREMGGYLAAIQNQHEFNAIKVKLSHDTQYWLGINDIQKEGEFVSVASGRRAPFLKWREGEPNNSGDGEDFVILNNGKMNDCWRESKEFFICQSDDKI